MNEIYCRWLTVTCLLAFSLVPLTLLGEVTESATDGFQIVMRETTQLNPQDAYRVMVEEFSQWYDASHSYGGVPQNLALDLERHAMLEQLPEGGFVRHMEIVFHQPGKVLRMTGGLGPLQGMGVSGALTFAFQPVESGTEITLTYQVSGSSLAHLDKIAGPVDGVLTTQLKRLKNQCDKQP